MAQGENDLNVFITLYFVIMASNFHSKFPTFYLLIRFFTVLICHPIFHLQALNKSYLFHEIGICNQIKK